MAYNAPPLVTTGQLATASDYNTYVRDNIVAVHAGEIAIAGQAVGAFVSAASATQLTTTGQGDLKLLMEVFAS